MCNFKSGLIFKNKVVLCPDGNESHSDLLDSLKIEDNRENAARKFVRAELRPCNGNKMSDVSMWEYRVDQDIVPDWYDKDPIRYEQDFREAVTDYIANLYKDYVNKFGYYWKKIQDGNREIYIMVNPMGNMIFGKTNDYTKSKIRNYLQKSDLADAIRKEYGDRVVPIEVDLTSMDGFKTYGKVTDEVLSLPTIPFLMKYGEEIPLSDYWYWTATPNQTSERNNSSCVQYVSSDGHVYYYDCFYNDLGVRPFFIIQS